MEWKRGEDRDSGGGVGGGSGGNMNNNFPLQLETFNPAGCIMKSS